MGAIRGRADVEEISEISYRKRNWPNTGYELLVRAARLWPEHSALVFLTNPAKPEENERFSYTEMLANVNRAANLFAACGAGRDTVVAHAMGNRPQAYFARWGAEAANIALGINPALDDDEVIGLLARSQTSILVTEAYVWHRLMDRVPDECPRLAYVFLVGESDALGHPDVSVQQFDTALANEDAGRMRAKPSRPGHDGSWFCTSGTTGPPKIARRTLAAATMNAVASAMMLGDHLHSGTTLLAGMPFFHVNTASTCGPMAWFAGAEVVLGGADGYQCPALRKNFWRIVERYKVNLCMATPPVYAQLLQVPVGGHDISTLEYCVTGAAPLPRALKERFESATGLKLLEGYGITEGSFTVTVNPPDGERRAGSVGIGVPWQKIRVVELDMNGHYVRDCRFGETGWILISGPQLLEGYTDDALNRGIFIDCGDGTQWFNTADFGKVDADGYYWLSGRREDLIIRDGRKIDPKLIEDPICRHPMVTNAVAVGRPDASAGELPVAYVQLREGGQSDSEALMDFLRSEIDMPENMPVAIRILKELPLTPVGRVHKLSLVADETRDVVHQIARELGVPVSNVDVRVSMAFGKVVTVEGASEIDALQEALRPLAFYSIVKA